MMKIKPELVIRAAILAGGVLLGSGGTITAQKASSAPVKAVEPQIIEIRPACPDIYLDHVKVRK